MHYLSPRYGLMPVSVLLFPGATATGLQEPGASGAGEIERERQFPTALDQFQQLRSSLVAPDGDADRVSTARAMMVLIGSSDGLTGPQRYEGSRLAGHVLFGAGEMAEAHGAFRVSLDNADEAIDRADQYRMLAQTLAHGAVDEKVELLRSSFDAAAESGHPASSLLAGNASEHLIALLASHGRWQDVVDHAVAVQGLNIGLGSKTIGIAIRGQGNALLRLGDRAGALAAYRSLRTALPSYGLDKPMGNRVSLEIAIFELETGAAFDADSTSAVRRMAEIAGDDRYRGTFEWASVCQTLATALQTHEKFVESARYRESLDGQLRSYQESAADRAEAMYASQWQQFRAQNIYMLARLYGDHLEDEARALAVLDRIDWDSPGAAIYAPNVAAYRALLTE